ncbi:hypothetical protein [Actinomadura flavalba]|uniref:hypothetical protein n=1 Tax=Actinomadura flavalba TaxID=1120938 RepID=UPI000377802A|nr:hypothetical protein [Actinomadura flavalba]
MTLSAPRHDTARAVAEELASARAPRPAGNDFLVRLGEDRVTADDLRRLVRAETASAAGELSAYAAMAVRYPHPVFPALLDMAYRAVPRIAACARATGLDADRLARPPTRFSAYAYPAYLSWLALNAGRAGIGAAIYADLDGYYADGLLVAEGLRASGAKVPGELVDYYSAPVPDGLCEGSLSLLQEGLDAGDDAADALRLGRMMQKSLDGFWRSALPE